MCYGYIDVCKSEFGDAVDGIECLVPGGDDGISLIPNIGISVRNEDPDHIISVEEHHEPWY